ncbi:MAG: S1C family serine protease [Planctomycetota bacterium]
MRRSGEDRVWGAAKPLALPWVLACSATLAAQATDALFDAERARIAIMAAVAPSVCSVMPLEANGGGSGVVFDPHGFVLTNFHVVGKPDVKEMKIGLPDGQLYRADVLGVDIGSDLAVLLLRPREDGAAWPFAPLGDSDALLVGEEVFAMGNPFLLATDFTPTTTFGIVSGTHRYQPGQGNRALVYPDCIQVDAPVNPGNSGGPLFNLAGEIVGINGRISIQDQRGRVNVGVGFAIAANQIRNFLPDLMAGRFVEHGTLDMNAWFMERNGRLGVFVQSVFADSLVRTLGLSLGDEITHFCDVPIRSANQLATMVGVLPEGTWVRLGWRPYRDDDAFGPEQSAEFRLTRLDTGSSSAADRLAARPHRDLALRAAIAAIADEPGTTTAQLEIRSAEGRRVILRRSGENLRIDDDARALVLRADDSAFAIENDNPRDASAEEFEKLRRIRAGNVLLRDGRELRELLAGGEFLGGTMIDRQPAWRIAIPGDGEITAYLFLDGSAAGCSYRDPVQKAVIELRRLGDWSRIVKSGALASDWSIGATTHPPIDDAVFRRPTP